MGQLKEGKLYDVSGIRIIGPDYKGEITRDPVTYKQIMYTGNESILPGQWDVFLSDYDIDNGRILTRVRIPKDKLTVSRNKVTTEEELTRVYILLRPNDHHPSITSFLKKAETIAEQLPESEKKKWLLAGIYASLYDEFNVEGINYKITRISLK